MPSPNILFCLAAAAMNMSAHDCRWLDIAACDPGTDCLEPTEVMKLEGG